MIFEQLNDGSCRTYLLGCERTKRCILVDPVIERVDVYLDAVERNGLVLDAVIDTHVHADHISGAASIRDRTGVSYVMHTSAPSACANVRVADGDVLSVGDVGLRVLHTPGHTQDSISLLSDDRILTGDFLFLGEGGAGRTDLPGGDAGEHWDALQKLRDLPGDLLVFPAHDYHGRTHSTLRDERTHNERLKPRSREEYVAWLASFDLGPADWMRDVVKANYACALDPRAAWIPVDVPACEVRGTAGNVNATLVATITAEAAARALASERPPLFLDVREPAELADELGHIAGSRNIPVGQLASRLSELESATAEGFSDVRSLEGGMRRWNELGYAVRRS
jgi:glyoxylase-like metal-dependent hydrolase (beta-lactamase superfamily II)/rhodanese-related sulfurtransferase